MPIVYMGVRRKIPSNCAQWTLFRCFRNPLRVLGHLSETVGQRSLRTTIPTCGSTRYVSTACKTPCDWLNAKLATRETRYLH
ncbi:hypothetical protein PSPO01_08385 [Paraphaeosphaeria sporulosa]